MAVVVLFTTLNKEKVAITATDFVNIMNQKSYMIQDVTSQFAIYDNYVTKGYIALAYNGVYQIEFYELSSEENAINMYNFNKEKFKQQKASVAKETKIENSNYGQYSLKTNGTYKYISRIGNTIVYLDIDEAYEDTVKDIIKEIGY